MMMKNSRLSYLLEILSINETRVSVIVFSFLLTLGFALYRYVTHGDIGANMLSLLLAQLTAIAGVNITESFSMRRIDSIEVVQDESSSRDITRPTI
jgi:hypothetical protein